MTGYERSNSESQREHNIIKRSNPSGRCIKNGDDSLLDITAWTQEDFQKSLSVNTVQCASNKLAVSCVMKERSLM